MTGQRGHLYRHHRAIPMVRITTCRVEFFVRRYKNSQAVAELQARIFVKDHGKGASECATEDRELRGGDSYGAVRKKLCLWTVWFFVIDNVTELWYNMK